MRTARIQEIVESTLRLDPEARPAFLAVACGGDEVLRREVEVLLDTSEPTRPWTEAGPQPLKASGNEAATRVGDRIGPYLLTRLIASGGMGAVYQASRADLQFRQQVAVKLIRAGLTREETIARFRTERQILANLQHPNIARLLDGGVTEDGLPHLVMEYVDGLSIDRYVKEHATPLRDRLALFRQVAAAVQFAHQNLIVHRDIKPANILVTAGGTPKLLDFGIAKLLDREAADPQAMTGFADRLMTPEYASPEQVRAETITTATDVYALGVLLYELTAGRRPFQLKTSTAVEIERLVCETEPPPPSTFARLDPEIDNIVLMAMRKEPARRYASAADFSEDVRRYLEGYPVAARQDAWSYRAGKFVRRNKAAVAAAALFAIVVTGLAIGMSVLAQRARTERDVARTERQTAERTTQFLTGLFLVADPETARGRTISAREVLDSAAGRIAAELHSEPEVQARLLETVGKVYENLGEWRESRAALERALEIKRRLHGGRDHPSVAQGLKDLTELLRRDREFAPAERLIREGLAMQIRLNGPEHGLVAEAMNTLALVLQGQGELAGAEALFRKALAMRALMADRPHLETAVLSNLGGLLRERGDLPGAERYLRECVAIRRRELGNVHPRLALALSRLGDVLRAAGNPAGSEPLLREAVAIRTKLYGDSHPDMATSLNSLGRTLIALGRGEEAAALHLRALAIQRRKLGNGVEAALTLELLGSAAQSRQQWAEAARYFAEALRLLPDGHGLRASVAARLAEVRVAARRP